MKLSPRWTSIRSLLFTPACQVRLAAAVVVVLSAFSLQWVDAQTANSAALGDPSTAAAAHLSLTAGAALPEAPQPQSTASLRGRVLDAAGAPIPGAQVTVISRNPPLRRITTVDSEGAFELTALPPGAYSVSVAVPGVAPFSAAQITLTAGQVLELPLVAANRPHFSSTVHVNATIAQVAQAQVKQAEKQRVLAVVPNFYSSYIWNAAPMTPSLKFHLAFRSIIDPMTFATTAGVAGVEQWHNTFPGYGSGAEGYGKRYGASLADTVISRMVGKALLPSLFHQDPRYFYRGKGSTSARLLYALKETVMCRGDNGQQEPNYSGILGNFIASGASNLYRAPQDRQVGLTFRNGLIITGAGAIDNILREFLSRGLTSNVPPGANGKP